MQLAYVTTKRPGLQMFVGLYPTAPSYLAEELHQSSADEARQRLRYASTSSLVVRRTRLSTIDDRAFPVAASRLWNTLPQNVTSAPTVTVLKKRLIGFPQISCSARTVTVISDAIIDLFLLTYLRVHCKLNVALALVV